jgi:hypothetical protein
MMKHISIIIPNAYILLASFSKIAIKREGIIDAARSSKRTLSILAITPTLLVVI